MHVERMRKALETAVKEMQVRLEEAEQAALLGGKKVRSPSSSERKEGSSDDLL